VTPNALGQHRACWNLRPVTYGPSQGAGQASRRRETRADPKAFCQFVDIKSILNIVETPFSGGSSMTLPNSEALAGPTHPALSAQVFRSGWT